MSILQRLDDFKRLWKLLLPFCTMPKKHNILRCVDRFADSASTLSTAHGSSVLAADTPQS